MGIELNCTLKDLAFGSGLAASGFFEAVFSSDFSTFGGGAGAGTALPAETGPGLRGVSITESLPTCGAGKTIGAEARGAAGACDGAATAGVAGRVRIMRKTPAAMTRAAARPAPIQTFRPELASAAVAAAASGAFASPVRWEGSRKLTSSSPAGARAAAIGIGNESEITVGSSGWGARARAPGGGVRCD